MPMFSGDVMYEQDGLRITRTERVLVMSTRVPHACLSFAPRGGGEQTTTHVANHHVASHELSLEVDALALLEALGRPIVSSSASVDGHQYNDPDDLMEHFGQADLVLDAGWGGLEPSTIVDLTGPAPEVVRQGAGVVDFA